jgi:DNA-binding MarR family transcriptional regulator
VFVLEQAVGRLLGAAMAGGPLNPAEYAAYSVVFDEEAVTPTVMSRRLGMPLTTVIDQVRSMERRGHLRRVPNPADGRSFKVVLTGEGLAAHRGANRQFEAAHARLIEALDVDPKAARVVLRALARAAERAGEVVATPR